MKDNNSNVESLPLISRLQVRSMGTKCEGVCGACIFMGCFAQVECAEAYSEATE